MEMHVQEMEQAEANDKIRILDMVAKLAAMKSRVGIAEGQVAPSIPSTPRVPQRISLDDHNATAQRGCCATGECNLM